MPALKQVELGSLSNCSWSTSYPLFYGKKTTDEFVHKLKQTELALLEGEEYYAVDVGSARVLAAFHGYLGAKVPLTCSTVSGCIRPTFVEINSSLKNRSPSCYDGGCYLHHARAVPAKKAHSSRILAQLVPKDGVIAAANLSNEYGLPIRDNQSSDGSVSMSLPSKRNDLPEVINILETLNMNGYQHIPYLCFSAAYARVPEKNLIRLGKYKNLIVHVTVSGWHEKIENCMRINEFLRYSGHLQNVFIRIVNRMDWFEKDAYHGGSREKCENWLLNKLVKLNLEYKIIRTPYHSVRPFPGSATGNLGSRHMASTDYSGIWRIVLESGAKECCKTGKCKTCSVLCGSKIKVKTQNFHLAVKAYESLLAFERKRQTMEGIIPLAAYTERLLIKKILQIRLEHLGGSDCEKYFKRWNELNMICKNLPLSSSERNRLTNDCHALVIDGIDRHKLWDKAVL